MGKTLDRMRLNPKADWRTEDIEKACREVDLDWMKLSPGSDDKIEDPSGGRRYTIPAHRPIKARYIQEFLRFLNEIGKA